MVPYPAPMLKPLDGILRRNAPLNRVHSVGGDAPPPTQENPATEADRPTADAIVGNPLDYGRQRTVHPTAFSGSKNRFQGTLWRVCAPMAVGTSSTS